MKAELFIRHEAEKESVFSVSCVCVCRVFYLHGVVGVFVVKDESFLNELVVSLQLVDLWLVVDDALLVLA